MLVLVLFAFATPGQASLHGVTTSGPFSLTCNQANQILARLLVQDTDAFPCH